MSIRGHFILIRKININLLFNLLFSFLEIKKEIACKIFLICLDKEYSIFGLQLA
jgi:hypothetical protein